jgi:hypothetical protein
MKCMSWNKKEEIETTCTVQHYVRSQLNQTAKDRKVGAGRCLVGDVQTQELSWRRRVCYAGLYPNVTEKFSLLKVPKPFLYCPESCERITDEWMERESDERGERRFVSPVCYQALSYPSDSSSIKIEAYEC